MFNDHPHIFDHVRLNEAMTCRHGSTSAATRNAKCGHHGKFLMERGTRLSADFDHSRLRSGIFSKLKTSTINSCFFGKKKCSENDESATNHRGHRQDRSSQELHGQKLRCRRRQVIFLTSRPSVI